MTYQETIKKVVQEFYDVTKSFATSRHYTISYWWIKSNFGLDLNDEQVRTDVHEMSYSNEFSDKIESLDFDNDTKEVLVMIWESNNKKRYTINDYKEFNNNALVLPPIDEFEDGSIDEQEWYKNHKIHIVVDNHDMELDYLADNVTEIYSALEEMYEIEKEVNEEINNNCTEFKTKLTEVFKTHMFMQDRDCHSVNELLYILEHDTRFDGEDFNISICTLAKKWICIPCVDAFVDVKTRGVWFNDADVEFEVEECGEE